MFGILKNNKNKYILTGLLILVMAGFIFLLPSLALAQDVDVGLEYAEGTGLGDRDPRVIAANVIRIILGFLGIVAVGLMMYAGWIWMTSEGNEEKVGQAKSILKNALIGLVIILSSFALATFVLNRIVGSTTGIGPGGGGPGGGRGSISALGNGIIDAHYPTRNQKDVPRNTKIVITFKEAMDASTIMAGENINSENIKIYRTIDGIDNFLPSDQVNVNETDDNKIFIFKPSQYLGSPSEKIWYTVALTVNIKKANGDLAFAGVVGEVAYEWSFEVGNRIDTTPPKVESIVPAPDSTEPRNVVIQINFNEPIDPTSAAGMSLEGFNNILVNNIDDGLKVQGNFYISNGYQTIEFLTEDACGVNSCGDTVYCLPGGKNLSVLAKAATLVLPGEPTASFPYDGLVDMADNSLDGNRNGQAQGGELQSGMPAYNENSPDSSTQGDDYIWSFNTSNEIDISAPLITGLKPRIGQEGISLDFVPEILFNKLLMARSLNTSSVSFSNDINYWIRKFNNTVDKKTTVYLNHDQFLDSSNYDIETNSGIRDIYQNCYSPCSGSDCAGDPSCCQGLPSPVNSCF